MQKLPSQFILSFSLTLLLAVNAFAQETTLHTGTQSYGEYQNWRLLGVSHRQDKKTLRAILGNDTAIEAARKAQTKTWPDGAVLAKIAWKENTHSHWPQAIIPGDFEKAEAMIKDSKKYASTGGWGFAYWEGKKLIMHPEAKAKECFACHTAVKDNDYVFTAPALQ